jgi:Fe2+ or Zn2+ uptake regulation protein
MMVDATAHRDPAVVRQVRGSHHHLVCRGCGRTEDVGCVAGEWPCLKLAGERVFVIDEAEVVFSGLCPACQRARGSVT